MQGLRKNWLIYMAPEPVHEKMTKQIPKSLLSVHLDGICPSSIPEELPENSELINVFPRRGRHSGQQPHGKHEALYQRQNLHSSNSNAHDCQDLPHAWPTHCTHMIGGETRQSQKLESQSPGLGMVTGSQSEALHLSVS